MKNFISEFKEFISRGNVMDLAVGVIIGAAFTGIINSLVTDIINPFIGLFLGGVDFSSLFVTLGAGDNAAKLMYGNFISAIIQFLIIALVVFCIVKAINKLPRTTPTEEVVIKICPYCKTEIDIDASKCPNCTSDLQGGK